MKGGELPESERQGRERREKREEEGEGGYANGRCGGRRAESGEQEIELAPLGIFGTPPILVVVVQVHVTSRSEDPFDVVVRGAQDADVRRQNRP